MRLINYVRTQVKELPWIFIGLLLLARIGVAEANWIPTGSMQPTLPVGDFLVVDKTAYGFSLPFVDKAIVQWNEPKRGDIVTFDPQHTEDRLIKRVIGKAGDEVMIRNGITYLNGHPLAQSFENGLIRENLNGISYYTTPAYPVHFGPIKVPENHVFVLGDNRSNSADSRYWGFLPINRIKGKATHRIFTTAWFKQNDFGARFGSLYQ